MKWEDMKAKYRGAYALAPLPVLFISIMMVSFLVFVLFALLSNGETFSNLFFGDKKDTFMDFFNSVMYSSDHPYTKYHVIYPPLITVFYGAIGYFTIPHVMAQPFQSLAFGLRASQVSMMVYMLISLISFYLLHVSVKKMTSDICGARISELLFVVMLFSYPIMFGFERGNSILIAILLILGFLNGYKSENRYVRLLSYISLGCAIGIKIYPALFAFLLLRDRKIHEFLICLILIVVVFMLPFLATDGNLLMLLSLAFSYSDEVTNLNGIINLKDLFSVFGISGTITTFVSGVVTLLVIIITIFSKNIDNWKIITLICCSMICNFSISTPYLFTYFIIVALFFFVEEKEVTKMNLIFVVILGIIFALFPTYSSYNATIYSSMRGIIVLATLTYIIYVSLRSMIEKKTEVRL